MSQKAPKPSNSQGSVPDLAQDSRNPPPPKVYVKPAPTPPPPSVKKGD